MQTKLVLFADIGSRRQYIGYDIRFHLLRCLVTKTASDIIYGEESCEIPHNTCKTDECTSMMIAGATKSLR